MKKTVITVLPVFIFVAALSLQIGATDLPLDGTWIKLVQLKSVDDFFDGGPWTFVGPAKFDITDWNVVSDAFKVYDSGVLVLTTPIMPNWDKLGYAGPFTSPPWTGDPDEAWANPLFSKGYHLFGPGSHEITIQTIAIPPDANGQIFSQSTVAFRALAPLPSSLLFFGTGLLGGLAILRRKTQL